MTESLKLCEVECLFAHLHFPVQTAFLRQVADAVYIIGVYRASVQEYGAAVRRRDLVNDADKRCLARSVRPQEAVNALFGNAYADPVKRCLGSKAFRNLFGFK